MGDKNYKVDKSQNKKRINETRDVLKTKGSSGAHQKEPIPLFNHTPRETFISNRNSWIVLGGDRSASPLSGKAGHGSTQASSIDMVVGRGAGVDGEPPDNDKKLDPNFFEDAARVYITQKGDVDTSFGIAEGVYGDFMTTDRKSAFVAKADHVRLMAREGVKIVTGKAKNAGGVSEKNSLGNEIGKVPPIQFIAGNYTDDNSVLQSNRILQPLAKGENLVEYLNELQRMIGTVLGMVQSNTKDLAICNGTLAGLTAPVIPLAGLHVSLATIEGIRSFAMIAEQQNLVALKVNYLEPVGSTYINSGHVFTT